MTESGIEIKQVYSGHNTHPEKPENFRLQEEFNLTCTEASCGRCVNMPGFLQRKKATNVIITCWDRELQVLSVAFDLPTQIGMIQITIYLTVKLAKPRRIDSIRDMEILFDKLNWVLLPL